MRAGRVLGRGAGVGRAEPRAEHGRGEQRRAAAIATISTRPGRLTVNAPQRPISVLAARLLGLVALAQERHLQAVDPVADQRQQAGQQERRVEHGGEHAERAAHAELGDERDADHGQAGDRDRDRHAGEDHRAARRRRRVGGGLARRHAVVQRLSEARDDEERVVDADADSDHRDEDRRDRVEVGQVGQQEEQREGRADRDAREQDRARPRRRACGTRSAARAARTAMPMSSLAPCSGGA